MRYIDRTNCKSYNEAGVSREIRSLGKLTATACSLAKKNGLAVLKARLGHFRIIRECGLGGVCDDFFYDLAEVDAYIKRNYK